MDDLEELLVGPLLLGMEALILESGSVPEAALCATSAASSGERMCLAN